MNAARHDQFLAQFDARVAVVALDYATLISRAESRSEAPGDYWHRSAAFLRDLRAARAAGPTPPLSAKQQSWLSALRQDLVPPLGV